MTSKPDLEDYKTVPERISEFRAKYPDGRLRPVNPDRPYVVHEIGQHTFIVYVAAAYRDAGDELPGIGVAWEPFPGTTPYTRNSELMNAETSAWGRAIVAALAADTQRSVASREEVRNRTEASGGDSKRSARSLTPAQQKAARTPDPARGQTPTEQREARARRIAEEKAVAQAKAPGRPADRGPLPDSDNAWQSPVKRAIGESLDRARDDMEGGGGHDWQEATPEDRPGTASSGQKRAIEALLTKAGCRTGTGESVRDERHAVVLNYLPKLEALKSMNHLSFNEAAAVIRALSADTGDEKMPQTVPDHAQRAANDWPEDPWAGDAPDWTRS